MEQRHPKHKGGLRHTVMKQGMQLAIGNLVKRPAGVMEEGKYGERVKGGMMRGVGHGGGHGGGHGRR
ncbi:hypothetical protein B0T16DRAFT_411516 [Cercophora newfieldiana]|uniref:Uncharacterized protein n=1 Tax=Cercophora newfieldiana TaxID=92897 RepID=A0AA39Y3Z1_9PEZI|nr:hypothetical protein B0T16DRAFT_411516 [Cercophora newfieldiana]